MQGQNKLYSHFQAQQTPQMHNFKTKIEKQQPKTPKTLDKKKSRKTKHRKKNKQTYRERKTKLHRFCHVLPFQAPSHRTLAQSHTLMMRTYLGFRGLFYVCFMVFWVFSMVFCESREVPQNHQQPRRSY